MLFIIASASASWAIKLYNLQFGRLITPYIPNLTPWLATG